MQLVCPSAVGLGARAEGDVRGVGGGHGAEAGFGGIGGAIFDFGCGWVWGAGVGLLEDMEDWVEEVPQIYLLADLDLLCGERHRCSPTMFTCIAT